MRRGEDKREGRRKKGEKKCEGEKGLKIAFRNVDENGK